MKQPMSDSTLNKLDRKTFTNGMKKLEYAFIIANPLAKETLKVYYEMLSYCDDDKFSRAIDDIIRNEQWFPTISKLLEYLPKKESKQLSVRDLTS